MSMKPFVSRMLGPPQSLSRKERAWQIFLHLAVWYLVSSGVQFYNKWFFTGGHALPVFISGVYNLIHVMIAYLIVWKYPKFLPKKKVTGLDYWINVFPTGMLVGFENTLSTMSIPDLRVIFFIVVRCTVPIFAIFFLWIMDALKMNMKLILVMMIILLGLYQTVISEPDLHADAFMLAQMSTVVSGVRLALVQLLLSDPEMGINNAISTIYHLAPVSSFSLLSASLVVYGIPNILQNFFYLTGWQFVGMFFGTVLGGVLTFIIQMLLLRVIIVTDAVTFATASVFKDAFTVFLARFAFGEHFDNLIGFGLILVGMLLYNLIKLYSQKSHDSEKEEDLQWDSHPTDPLLNKETKVTF